MPHSVVSATPFCTALHRTLAFVPRQQTRGYPLDETVAAAGGQVGHAYTGDLDTLLEAANDDRHLLGAAPVEVDGVYVRPRKALLETRPMTKYGFTLDVDPPKGLSGAALTDWQQRTGDKLLRFVTARTPSATLYGTKKGFRLHLWHHEDIVVPSATHDVLLQALEFAVLAYVERNTGVRCDPTSARDGLVRLSRARGATREDTDKDGNTTYTRLWDRPILNRGDLRGDDILGKLELEDFTQALASEAFTRRREIVLTARARAQGVLVFPQVGSKENDLDPSHTFFAESGEGGVTPDPAPPVNSTEIVPTLVDTFFEVRKGGMGTEKTASGKRTRKEAAPVTIDATRRLVRFAGDLGLGPRPAPCGEKFWLACPLEEEHSSGTTTPTGAWIEGGHLYCSHAHSGAGSTPRSEDLEAALVTRFITRSGAGSRVVVDSIPAAASAAVRTIEEIRARGKTPVIHLVAPMGAGKTQAQALVQMAVQRAALVVAPTRALTLQLALAKDATNYTDLFDGTASPDRDVATTVHSLPNVISTAYAGHAEFFAWQESLHERDVDLAKLPRQFHQFWEGRLLVIDEPQSCVAAAARQADWVRGATFEALRFAVSSAHAVLTTSATPVIALMDVFNTVPNTEVVEIAVDVQRASAGELVLGDVGGFLSTYADLLKADDARVFVSTFSKRTIKGATQLARKLGKRVAVLTGDSSTEARAAFYDAAMDADVVLVNQAAGDGVSVPGTFTATVSLFDARPQSPEPLGVVAAAQLVMRARDVRGPRYVFAHKRASRVTDAAEFARQHAFDIAPKWISLGLDGRHAALDFWTVSQTLNYDFKNALGALLRHHGFAVRAFGEVTQEQLTEQRSVMKGLVQDAAIAEASAILAVPASATPVLVPHTDADHASNTQHVVADALGVTTSELTHADVVEHLLERRADAGRLLAEVTNRDVLRDDDDTHVNRFGQSTNAATERARLVSELLEVAGVELPARPGDAPLAPEKTCSTGEGDPDDDPGGGPSGKRSIRVDSVATKRNEALRSWHKDNGRALTRLGVDVGRTGSETVRRVLTQLGFTLTKQPGAYVCDEAAVAKAWRWATGAGWRFGVRREHAAWMRLVRAEPSDRLVHGARSPG